MARVRSKHNNLLNYFIHDRRDLSPAYVASCEKFLKKIKKKERAQASKLSSFREGGPAHKESGCKPSSLTRVQA